MESPYFQFSFTTNNSGNQWIAFEKPLAIHQTTDINEVITVLEQVNNAIQRGYYAAGFLSYEAAPAFDQNYDVVAPTHSFPLIYFAIFKAPTKPKREQLHNSYQLTNWSFISNYQTYQKGIESIKQAIKQGDTYQVNYTTQMKARFSGDAYALYQHLAAHQKAAYSAYIQFEHYRLLSASPELFFRVNGQEIITKPMKGTAARGRFLSEDNKQKEALYHSEKERAENLMIVDLLRNDLGKLAKLGSVKVTKQLEVETYPTVHQMTSTIVANLKENTTVVDWFRALFPCGSITGAPKIKTMEYIASLEQTPRGVYCGAIGYITPNQEAIFNVPIRTVTIDCDTNQATYGVGSGITWDSEVPNEFAELKTKAKLLTENRREFELLETMLLTKHDYPFLSYHLKRLKESALFFNIPFQLTQIQRVLDNHKQQAGNGTYRVRLLVNQQGDITATMKEWKNIVQPVTCKLAQSPIDATNIFHYHKTTNRSIYDKHMQTNDTVFSVLLWNKNEEITEFTFGNVVVEINGSFYTPPLFCGVLPGTYRAYLLQQAQIKEKVMTKDVLKQADKIWFINSLRGWVEVELT